MAKEILKTIAEAEAEADRIRANARAEAEKTVARAEAEGKELLVRTEKELTAKRKNDVGTMTEKIEAVRADSREKSEEENAALRKSAEVRMREAVRVIMGEVATKCQ